MKKTGILVAVVVVALFFVACGGGGGGGGTTPSGGQTPTVAPTTPTAVQITGELVQITATADFTFEPSIIELKIGKPYQVQFLNRGVQGHRLRIPRWDINLFAAQGEDSPVSNVFVPDTAGEFDAYDQITGAARGMRAIIRVSP